MFSTTVLILAGSLTSVSLAADFPGWWLHINDRVAYDRAQSDPASACALMPGGAGDVTNALMIDPMGDFFDCKSSDPGNCTRSKGLRVNFGSGRVLSSTDPLCSGQLDSLDSGNLRFSGGCEGEFDQVELFSVTEQGYRNYAGVARRCRK